MPDDDAALDGYLICPEGYATAFLKVDWGSALDARLASPTAE